MEILIALSILLIAAALPIVLALLIHSSYTKYQEDQYRKERNKKSPYISDAAYKLRDEFISDLKILSRNF